MLENETFNLYSFCLPLVFLFARETRPSSRDDPFLFSFQVKRYISSRLKKGYHTIVDDGKQDARENVIKIKPEFYR